MTKRRKFLATSLLLSLGFFGIQFLESRFRIVGIIGLSLITIPLFIWSLWEGLGWNMTLMTLILSVLFTAGVGTFWFLLPASIYARLPIVFFYAFGIYALNSTMNVFTVGAIRTIALLRAARGVGFVLTLVTSFLIFNAIISLKIPFWGTALAIGFLAFPLFLQGFWSVSLEKEFKPDPFVFAAVSSVMVGEIALALAFWPVTLVVGSLFLTVAVYVLLGLGQAQLEQRLFSQTLKEYLTVGILVFAGMFFATHWS